MRTLLHAVGGDGAATMDGWKIMATKTKPSATERRASQPMPGSADAAVEAAPAEAVGSLKSQLLAWIEANNKFDSNAALASACGYSSMQPIYKAAERRSFKRKNGKVDRLCMYLGLDREALTNGILKPNREGPQPPPDVDPDDALVAAARRRADWPRIRAVIEAMVHDATASERRSANGGKSS